MKNFALFLRVNTSMSFSADPQEYADRMAWLAEIVAKGRMVNQGGTMPPIPEAASTIFADGSRKDGAFMETAHFITGYLIVAAENLEEAVDMAKTNPILKSGGSVEVREIHLR